MLEDLKSFMKLFRELHPYATWALLELFMEDPNRFFVEEFLAQLQMNHHQIKVFSNDPRIIDRPKDKYYFLVELGLLHDHFLIWWSHQHNHPDHKAAALITRAQFKESLEKISWLNYRGTVYLQCNRAWFELIPPKSRL